MALGVARESGEKFVLTCVDARMAEVYWAVYEVGEHGVNASGGEHLGAPSDVMPPSAHPWVLAGDALAGHGAALEPISKLASAVFPNARASAHDLLLLAAIEIEQGRVVSPESARPVYLRDASAWRRRS